MTELPLAIDRLRAAVNGNDFEWEIDGGSPFDDAKALLIAYDEQKVEIERLRAVAWAAQGMLNADTYVSDIPREQAVRDADLKLRQALGTWQMHHTAQQVTRSPPGATTAGGD